MSSDRDAAQLEYTIEKYKNVRTYLACPYTSPLPAIREYRHTMATIAAAMLFHLGIPVFSPLTHSVPLERALTGDKQANYPWLELDKSIIHHWAQGLCILTLEGWSESPGVAQEFDWAESLDQHIWYISQGDIAKLYDRYRRESGSGRLLWVKYEA